MILYLSILSFKVHFNFRGVKYLHPFDKFLDRIVNKSIVNCLLVIKCKRILYVWETGGNDMQFFSYKNVWTNMDNIIDMDFKLHMLHQSTIFRVCYYFVLKSGMLSIAKIS